MDEIDTIPNLSYSIREDIEEDLRSYVGSLNWLDTCTRQDLSTITNISSYYLHKTIPLHVVVGTYAMKYLKGTLSSDI